jgi:hypothetical protein
MIGGAAVIVGCLLPWAEIFAGLIGVSGIRGDNGKALAAAGALVVAAGLWHLARGSAPARWIIGVGGAGILGYSGYLLFRLAGTMRSLGGDSMVAVSGGPGLWIVAAGGLIAFGTLFLPASSQTAFRASGPDRGSLLDWAADRTSAGPRRWLQIGLGVAWLIDAGLQYQPYMFTTRFITQIIEPAGMGSPAVISNSIMGTSQVLLSQPVIFNSIFATIQLVLGIGLLWRPAVRAALVGTVIWALAVWFLGEGLGGLFTGTASPVTGAPGAALLYAIIAVLALPHGTGTDQQALLPASVAEGSRVGQAAARAIWAVFWLGAAALMLQPANLAPRALSQAVGSQADGEPGWIAAMNRGAASVIGSHGALISAVIAAIFVAIAAGVLVPRAARAVVFLAIGTAALIWVVGQDFGGLLTGQATDPNTGPLLALLAAAYWPRPGRSSADSHSGGAGRRRQAGAIVHIS